MSVAGIRLFRSAARARGSAAHFVVVKSEAAQDTVCNASIVGYVSVKVGRSEKRRTQVGIPRDILDIYSLVRNGRKWQITIVKPNEASSHPETIRDKSVYETGGIPMS